MSRPLSSSFPLLAAAALLFLPRLPCAADWTIRHHGETPWETTSDPADLDAEADSGAVILRYADGSYVHALHRQYPKSCGPGALAMVLHALGFDRPTTRLELPSDVDVLPGEPGPTVDVGHPGSIEHIMWLGYHRARLADDRRTWNRGDSLFMSEDGLLNATPRAGSLAKLDPHGETMAHLGFAASGEVPEWLWRGPPVGTGNDRNTWGGLAGIANYLFSGPLGPGCRDARPQTTFSRTDAEVRAFRRIVKGFVDHGIPLVLGIESGGHFNTLIGYRGDPEDLSRPFYLYTADPLDGWGRPERRRAGRWRRLVASGENLFNGNRLIVQVLLWNQHLDGGCEPGGWACELDQVNGNGWLCGRRIPPLDPLADHLAGVVAKLVRGSRSGLGTALSGRDFAPRVRARLLRCLPTNDN